MSRLFRIKPMSMLTQEASEEGENTLKRSLGAMNLITLGIGAVIGAGIFVLTGQAAAKYAGPAVALSFVLAGLTCTFAGLCYAEFASIIPIAGSAYTYGYATLGEVVAWIIGWDLVLEYAFGAATVASGWSGYFNSLLQQWHIYIPPQLTTTTGNVLVYYHDAWLPLMSLPPGVNPGPLPHATGFFNLIAMMIVMVITTILMIGIKESANFNSVIVVIKLGIVGIFLAIGGYFLFRHPDIAKANWHPFIPPSDGHGNFGWGGIPRGAARIFFAYIGFDAVSTAAQEAKKPQRDMPIGILGSLAVCTVLYILVSTVLTGLVPYRTFHGDASPVATVIALFPSAALQTTIVVGIICGYTSVILVMLLGQSRVFYSMSRDGLLPGLFSAIHPKFQTPYRCNLAFMVFVSLFSGFLPISKLGEMTSIGTLLAFVIVCIGIIIMRKTNPNAPRPYRTPLVPLVPILGVLVCFAMMVSLDLLTWIRLLVWLAIGLTIYFLYSRHHSHLNIDTKAAAKKR